MRLSLSLSLSLSQWRYNVPRVPKRPWRAVSNSDFQTWRGAGASMAIAGMARHSVAAASPVFYQHLRLRGSPLHCSTTSREDAPQSVLETEPVNFVPGYSALAAAGNSTFNFKLLEEARWLDPAAGERAAREPRGPCSAPASAHLTA